MTEQQFWNLLSEEYKAGRAPQTSGYMDISDPQMRAIGRYFEAHAILPKNYDKMPIRTLMKMSELLFIRTVSTKTKEAVLIILAHQKSDEILRVLEKYTQNPDKGVEVFSEFALSECRTWNAD